MLTLFCPAGPSWGGSECTTWWVGGCPSLSPSSPSSCSTSPPPSRRTSSLQALVWRSSQIKIMRLQCIALRCCKSQYCNWLRIRVLAVWWIQTGSRSTLGFFPRPKLSILQWKMKPNCFSLKKTEISSKASKAFQTPREASSPTYENFSVFSFLLAALPPGSSSASNPYPDSQHCF